MKLRKVFIPELYTNGHL